MKIRKNTIMLKKVRECNLGTKRMIYYEVDQIGDNIKYLQEGNKWVLNLSTTQYNSIFYGTII